VLTPDWPVVRAAPGPVPAASAAAAPGQPSPARHPTACNRIRAVATGHSYDRPASYWTGPGGGGWPGWTRRRRGGRSSSAAWRLAINHGVVRRAPWPGTATRCGPGPLRL